MTSQSSVHSWSGGLLTTSWSGLWTGGVSWSGGVVGNSLWTGDWDTSLLTGESETCLDQQPSRGGEQRTVSDRNVLGNFGGSRRQPGRRLEDGGIEHGLQPNGSIHGQFSSRLEHLDSTCDTSRYRFGATRWKLTRGGAAGVSGTPRSSGAPAAVARRGP